MENRSLVWDEQPLWKRWVSATIAGAALLSPVVILATLVWVTAHFVIKFW
jgi:hypothetical protein